MSVQGKGNIKVKVNGLTQVIQDVYFIPELNNNRLSIGQLQERNLAVLIQEGVCKIFHPLRYTCRKKSPKAVLGRRN